MSSESVSQILTLYSWFPFAALLSFLLLIARFYSRFSHKRTWYWLYLVPLVSGGVVIIDTASPARSHEGVLLLAAAIVTALSTAGLALHLRRLMLAHKPA